MSRRVNTKEKEAAMELFCVICRNGGVMNIEEAVSKLSKKNKNVVKLIEAEDFVNVYFPNIFKFQGGVDVEAVMPLKFCLEASEKSGCPDGELCVKLHLCPYYIRGKCSYQLKCRCSHNIKDRHTVAMLAAFGLENIDDATWFQLLKKVLADTQMERGASTHDVPDICKFYNNIGGCREGEKCAFLHVCQHFVDGTCKFGEGCKRDHDFLNEKHNRKILGHFDMRGLETKQLLDIFKGRERKRKRSATSTTHAGTTSSIKKEAFHDKAGFFPPWESSPAKRTKVSEQERTPENQSTDICGFFLQGKCNYGKKCMNLHRDLPYQWQLQDGPGWKDLSEDWNIMLERGYCDPSANKVLFYDQGQSFKTADFDKMIAVAEVTQTGPPLQLRRLSTESSADAPPGHIFSTRWLWYWLDEINQWQSYDFPKDGTKPNTTSSKCLEKDFLQGKESHSFSAGHSSYNLSYKQMNQKNMKTQTERAVRRRPEFVAKEKMKEIGKRRKEAIRLSFALLNATSSCVYDNTALPNHWNPMDDKTGYVLIELPSTSQEYTNVEQAFKKTLASQSHVKKIERVQNPDLWTAFVQKKGRMTKKASDIPPKEMPQLFHGTATDVVDAICQQGFDWRMCGKHGTLYGKGNYFARDASYSHRYTDHIGLLGDRKMLVARVLVGSSVLGANSLTRPPPKDPSRPYGDLHDSCVDNTLIPSIYVVFDNNQCYPEYLITYN